MLKNYQIEMTSQVHHKKSERRKGIVWSILSIMKDQYCFYQGENELRWRTYIRRETVDDATCGISIEK